ncbi:hypothetical protein HYH03_010417 [Edaphochlamys debaryana]|uniref:Uncharacterized protein n=1 Tax=Edaphochlamys debaryana TaxID=47281 RepID=A0A835XU43_9CHLO|nr:hypothetical protein HYH03_010417 [Edaphochlamys debaryana]|eukprot:KAG2491207.1 hypothetical protein HYH03_010417 [Edaphochlamys debaryana]
MDPAREQMRTALVAYGAELELFEEDLDLDLLWRSRYRTVGGLRHATREGLKAARLEPGLIDHIMALQGTAGAAAGQGVGTSGAGAAAGLGKESATGAAAAAALGVGSVAGAGSATAFCTPAALACVSRLTWQGATVGTAVRVAIMADCEGDLVLASRHCIEEQGACLPDLSAFGGPLQFLAARPDLDVAVFRGPRGPGFRLQQLPLQQGAALGMLSFPLAVDAELTAAAAGLPGGAASAATAAADPPVVDAGFVSKVSATGILGVASMTTGMPNSSGGAMLSDGTTLAGIFTSIVWHLEEIPDSSHAGSGGSGSGSGGSSSGRSSSSGGSGSVSAAIELNPNAMWTPPADTAPDAVAAVGGDPAQAAELSRLNIGHKNSASIFTTASALWQLLQGAELVPLEPVQQAAEKEARRRFCLKRARG